jgi:hypothetical protein
MIILLLFLFFIMLYVVIRLLYYIILYYIIFTKEKANDLLWNHYFVVVVVSAGVRCQVLRALLLLRRTQKVGTSTSTSTYPAVASAFFRFFAFLSPTQATHEQISSVAS